MSVDVDVDVMVVGAGPTGLAAANEAVRHGLSVRIVDRKPRRSAYSKALVVHARTLEVFEAMGVVDAVRAAGVPFAALRVVPRDGADPIRIDLLQLAWGDTRYPYWLSIPQYATEKCLEERLAMQGVSVDWNTAFRTLVDHGDHVEATVATGTVEQTVRARWLVGCDGGHSPVREQVGLGFDSASIGETFVIADALGRAPIPEDEGTTSLSSSGVLFLVPMPEAGRWRIIAHLPKHPEGECVEIDAALVDKLIADRLGFAFGAHDLSWTSQFVLKQGVAKRYRMGRVFIAGDAAHLHSPVGGQGLNTGVQDAYALMWRIAMAERAHPSHGALLDSYEAERRPVAQSMVANTTRATRVMMLHTGVLATLRGLFAPGALRAGVLQNQLGRSMGMLELAYKASPIVVNGPRGAVGPGSRMPNPELGLELGTSRLYDRLEDRRHTVLVLDPAGAQLASNLRSLGVACIEVNDEGLRGTLGGARLVVVRPDRVVAATSKTLDPAVVDRYATDTLGMAPQAL